jgi:hypothetical protein
MKITSNAELEKAVREHDSLQAAADGTPEAARREELQSAISHYYLINKDQLRKARPEHRE